MILAPFIKAHTNKNTLGFLPLELLDFVRSSISRIASSIEGIGVDTLIFYKREDRIFHVKVFNKDGSEAAICGNSLIALGGIYEFLSHERESIRVETGAGDRKVVPSKNGKGWIAEVSPLEGSLKKLTLNIEGEEITGFYTEAPGNPHFIVPFKPDDTLFSLLAPKISKHPKFSEGTNVEFVMQDEKNKDSVSVRVYERGVGETFSCATGAAAVYLFYKEVKNVKIKVLKFKGGSYRIEEAGGFITLQAEPVIIARGVVFV